MSPSEGWPEVLAAERERCLECLEMHRRDMEHFGQEIRAARPDTIIGPASV